MAETYLDWKDIEKLLYRSGMQKNQLYKIFTDKNSPWKNTSWRGKQGRKMKLGKAGTVLSELAKFGGATSSKLSRLQFMVKPHVYARDRSHGKRSKRPTSHSQRSVHAPSSALERVQHARVARRQLEATRASAPPPSAARRTPLFRPPTPRPPSRF